MGAYPWYRDLLRRMKIEIPGIRPALFTDATYLQIDELRTFRHLFRNLYARPLDPERTRLAQEKAAPAVRAFTSAHRDFAEQLRRIADGINDSE
jgi:hypothetical protein